MNFDTWIRQPSTIHGLGVAAAGVGAALAQLTTGNPTVDAIVAVSAYVLTHLGIDDNSAAEKSITAMTTDLIQGAAPARLLADAAPLANGVSALFTPASVVAVPSGAQATTVSVPLAATPVT